MNDLIQNIYKSCQGLFTPDELNVSGFVLDDQKLNDLGDKFSSLNVVEQLGLVHLDYYEHYKALILSLGLKILPRQKAILFHFTQGKKNLEEIHEEVRHTEEYKSFLELLITSYVIHRYYEKLYLLYLNSHYDPMFDRLLQNGIALHVYICINLPPKLTDQIFTQFGLPLKCDPQYKSLDFKNTHPLTLIYDFDRQMPTMNLWRLLLARMRRFLLNLQVCLQSAFLGHYLDIIEPFFGQFMAWVNVIYFSPRLMLDSFNFLYHLFFWKSEEPQAHVLSFYDRFWLLFNRRWETMFRDFLWLTNSLLSLFILTGTLGFMSFYVNAGIQLIETMLNLYLMYDSEYREDAILGTVNEINKAFHDSENHTLFEELNYRWTVDDRIREIRFYNSLGVLFSFILILPCMATISSIIPLIGAALGIMMSFIQFKSLNKFGSLRGGISDPLMPKKTSPILQNVNSLNLMTSN